MYPLTRNVLSTVALALTIVVGTTTAFAGKEDAPGQNRSPTIIDIALNDPDNFSTLTAAVVCTGLLDPLDGNRQFTVFAPTNDAFALLGLDANNICEVDGLAGILLYHVAPGERFSDDVLASDQIRMLNGDFTYPSIQAELPFINEAQIVIPDVDAVNGVVHVIGEVLLP